MLMVSSSVRVIHGILGHTSDLGPGLGLGPVLVVVVPGLKDGLVNASTSGDHPNHAAAFGIGGFSETRRQPNPSLLLLLRVTHHHTGGSRSPGRETSVTRLEFSPRIDGTL